MSRDELNAKLLANNVPERWYSIDGGLKPDACILYKNYAVWEYFYMDEKGNRVDFEIFHVEAQAYDFLWKKIERQLEVYRR